MGALDGEHKDLEDMEKMLEKWRMEAQKRGMPTSYRSGRQRKFTMKTPFVSQ